MTAKLTNGSIEIDICDLLDSLNDESKLKFIESLACDSAVVKHVADQIITGWTESGYSSGRFCTASPDPAYGLDWAVRQVALRSGEVAEKEIHRLQEALARKDKEINELYEENRRIRMGRV